MTVQEAKIKLYRFCAYQERCHQEVEEKLGELGIRGDDVHDIIHHLIQEGFLNEERFARVFVAGKFRLKQWGRIKIINELEQRNLSKHCIQAGLHEIEEEEYKQALRNLLHKKASQISAPNIYILRDKLSKYVIQKGFEPDLVWKELKSILPDNSKL